MIIFCEECGERYIIENDEIKEKVITFNCRVCMDPIKVLLPDAAVMNHAVNEGTGN